MSTRSAPFSTNPTEAAALWHSCKEMLAQEIPAQQFATWIKPLKMRESDSALLIEVSNRFKLDWIRAQYLQRIVEILEQTAGRAVPVELCIASRSRASAAPARKQSDVGAQQPATTAASTKTAKAATKPTSKAAPKAVATVSSSTQTDLAPVTEADIPAYGVTVGMPAEQDPRSRARLDPRYTFDALVEGSANRMARAAAMHVATAPGELYNPLFIYGGVGLGKTHLLHAVGHLLLDRRPQAQVLYTHAEQFVTDVVTASRRGSFDDFKARYHNLDLLLIDDVQFFGGKDKTQEEFFNTFEALLSRKSHIVMGSDTYPKGLANITVRLASRFDSGLSVAIEPPELEMRVAILMNKAQAEGKDLPEEVAFFVAKNVRANVRELEGALQNILAYSRFSGRAINIDLVRDALRDLLSIKNRQISVENIQKTVADYYKIKVADMHSKKRPANIARPRQIAMYLAKELTQKSLPEIGEMFGGRDHTTVLHAVRKITAERTNDPDMNQQLHVLEQTLRG